MRSGKSKKKLTTALAQLSTKTNNAKGEEAPGNYIN